MPRRVRSRGIVRTAGSNLAFPSIYAAQHPNDISPQMPFQNVLNHQDVRDVNPQRPFQQILEMQDPRDLSTQSPFAMVYGSPGGGAYQIMYMGRFAFRKQRQNTTRRYRVTRTKCSKNKKR